MSKQQIEDLQKILQNQEKIRAQQKKSSGKKENLETKETDKDERLANSVKALIKTGNKYLPTPEKLPLPVEENVSVSAQPARRLSFSKDS